MATLTRWKKHTPAWLDNREQPHPFAVEVKRATWGERKDFLAALDASASLPEDQRADALVAAFAPLLRGPVGDLVIDGERIGSTEALVRVALSEPNVPGNLFAELLDLVLGEATLGKAPATPSA